MSPKALARQVRLRTRLVKMKGLTLVDIGVSILPICQSRGMANRDDGKVSVSLPVLLPSLCCTRDLKSIHAKRQQAPRPLATQTVIPVEYTRRIFPTSRHRHPRRPFNIFCGKQAVAPVPTCLRTTHRETPIFHTLPTLRTLYCVALRKDGQEWMMRQRRKRFENWTDFLVVTAELELVSPALAALSA